MKSNSLLPELYVKDFPKSLHFYTQMVKFSIEYRREDPSFAFLSYQGSQLMIQEVDPNEDRAFITGHYEYPLGRGINFQIATNNVDEVAESLKAHLYPVRRELQDSWYRQDEVLYGCRQLLVQDPDGYLLRFSQAIGNKSVAETLSLETREHQLPPT